MTDFLYRLANRILGDSPLAQPLLAPRFAPGAEVFSPGTAPADDPQVASESFGEAPSPATIAAIAPAENASQPIESQPQPDPHRREPVGLSQRLTPKPPQAVASEAREPEPSAPATSDGAHGGDLHSHSHSRATEPPPAWATTLVGKAHSGQIVDPPGSGPVPASPAATQAAPMAASVQPRGLEPPPVAPGMRPQGAAVARDTEAMPTRDDISADESGLGVRRSVRRGDPSPPNVVSRQDEAHRLAMPAAEGSSQPVAAAHTLPVPERRDVQGRTDEVGEATPRASRGEPRQRPPRQTVFAATEAEMLEDAVQAQAVSVPQRGLQPERLSMFTDGTSVPRPSTPDQKAGLQAPPTIHVTIGRIELRAVPPPQVQVQETSSPAPKLSLDEYLKALKGR